VVHIDAGVRNRNIYSLKPEEINRRLTVSLTELHFAPTEKSNQNLFIETLFTVIYLSRVTL
jgi:UDP-N-acetylglucosamine 2-epimerase (non-hydrolysing)